MEVPSLSAKRARLCIDAVKQNTSFPVSDSASATAGMSGSWQDQVYFGRYDSGFVHEEMLRDSVRCQAYADAIFASRAAFAGGVVIDVGAGSGLLSCLCARAGARRVYAVEASGPSASLCREVVRANGLEKVVHVLESRLEDVELPAGELADAIVSEWMGYMLLFESMLDSVLLARDRWLRPGGLMMPSRAKLYLCPFTDKHWRQLRLEMLSNVSGIDLRALLPLLANEEASEPVVQGLEQAQLIGEPQLLLDLDLSHFKLLAAKEPLIADVRWPDALLDPLLHPIHGYASWFDVSFEIPAWSPRALLASMPLSERFISGDSGPAVIKGGASNDGGSVRKKEFSENAARPVDGGAVTGGGFLGNQSLHSLGHRKEITLSTGPGQPRTCWHQTLLYWPAHWAELQERCAAARDEHPTALRTRVQLSRPVESPRFLAVQISSWLDDDDKERNALKVLPASEEIPEHAADHSGAEASVKTMRSDQAWIHTWLLRTYAHESSRGPPLPVARLRGTSRAAAYGGAR